MRLLCIECSDCPSLSSLGLPFHKKNTVCSKFILKLDFCVLEFTLVANYFSVILCGSQTPLIVLLSGVDAAPKASQTVDTFRVRSTSWTSSATHYVRFVAEFIMLAASSRSRLQNAIIKSFRVVHSCATSHSLSLSLSLSLPPFFSFYFWAPLSYGRNYGQSHFAVHSWSSPSSSFISFSPIAFFFVNFSHCCLTWHSKCGTKVEQPKSKFAKLLKQMQFHKV